jgi:hypothetical protein
MIIKKTIFKTFAIVSFSFISSSTVFAHPNHDNCNVPLKWQFSENFRSKTERNLSYTNPKGIIDLNPFEQKKINHYGTKVGNKLSSIVQNIDVSFEKTSAGLKIKNISIFNKKMNSKIFPFTKTSKISMTKPLNSRNNHDLLQFKWVFGDTTNAKTVKYMFDGKGHFFLGLTNLEQNLLNKYRIKSRNKFQFSISGNNFFVERTSVGLVVLKHLDKENLTKTNLNKI